MGTRSRLWSKQKTCTLLPELPASNMTAYLLDPKSGENLRLREPMESEGDRDRKSRKVISRRGTEMRRRTPRYLRILSERESCWPRLRLSVFSIWSSGMCSGWASRSSRADGDRWRIWPFPGVSRAGTWWVSCTDSSSSECVVTLSLYSLWKFNPAMHSVARRDPRLQTPRPRNEMKWSNAQFSGRHAGEIMICYHQV